MPIENRGAGVPLAVDVDGSLHRGDLLFMGMARLLAESPWWFFALPIWLLGGRARLKRRVAQAVAVPGDALVLNPAVVAEMETAKDEGREVWLASGSDALAVASLAKRFAADGVLASDGRTNLTGQVKAQALVARFGERGFDYIGNERKDLAVWRHARCAIGVGLSASLAQRLEGIAEETRLLPGFDESPS